MQTYEQDCKIIIIPAIFVCFIFTIYQNRNLDLEMLTLKPENLDCKNNTVFVNFEIFGIYLVELLCLCHINIKYHNLSKYCDSRDLKITWLKSSVEKENLNSQILCFYRICLIHESFWCSCYVNKMYYWQYSNGMSSQ